MRTPAGASPSPGPDPAAGEPSHRRPPGSARGAASPPGRVSTCRKNPTMSSNTAPTAPDRTRNMPPAYRREFAFQASHEYRTGRGSRPVLSVIGGLQGFEPLTPPCHGGALPTALQPRVGALRRGDSESTDGRSATQIRLRAARSPRKARGPVPRSTSGGASRHVLREVCPVAVVQRGEHPPGHLEVQAQQPGRHGLGGTTHRVSTRRGTPPVGRRRATRRGHPNTHQDVGHALPLPRRRHRAERPRRAASRVLDLPDASVSTHGFAQTADRALGRLASPGLRGFWIHLDADALNPFDMPAVDSPEPGGPTTDQMAALLAPLVQHPRAIGLELASTTLRSTRMGPARPAWSRCSRIW